MDALKQEMQADPNWQQLFQMAINEQVGKQVMEECGLGKYVKDIKGFKIFKLMGRWMNDPEFVAELHHIVRISDIMKKPPEIGSVRPDIDLVSAETKEIIPLSTLRTHQSQPLACVLSGSLAKLFADYQDRANFLCVYQAEAHPKEKWNYGEKFCFMTQHKRIEDRIQAARDLIDIDSVHNTFTTNPSDNTKVRLVLDTMDNNFAITYSSHPDRIIIIGADDKIVFVGNSIIAQKGLMTDEARQWMEQNL
ncbi:thyroxine 5-deiodinase-like [Amphiura filiformis]|uniref:thyroxine 5-deiodinase-like n=1 Tax=Amphiura filiformis TaxID=82378 RepID=UPI003B20D9DB